MVAQLYKGTDWFPTDTKLETPEDCLKAYNQGLAGTFIDEEATEKLVASMEHKTFSDVMSMWRSAGIQRATPTNGLYLNGFAAVLLCEAQRLGVIKDVTPTLEKIEACSANDSIRPWDEKQDTGDCTSHGARNHADCVRASEIVYGNETEDWIVRTATEIHYGYRGHAGEGANSGRLREFICNVGGMFLRKDYTKELGVDLSVYNSRIGSSMGRTGVPKKFIEFSKPNNIRKLTQCKSLEEAIEAFRNGFTISGGGMHSFSEQRDANGFSDWTGPKWAHDTAQNAMDERPEVIKAYKSRMFLYQNSWWKWNSGGRKILGTNINIPYGSMWINERAMSTMIQNGEYYIMSGANGWQPLSLPDWGFSGNV